MILDEQFLFQIISTSFYIRHPGYDPRDSKQGTTVRADGGGTRDGGRICAMQTTSSMSYHALHSLTLKHLPTIDV